MNNNHTLDRLRAVLKLTDANVAECFTLAGHTLSPEAQAGLHSQAQGAARIALTDALLRSFLDGLIIARRGPRPSSSAASEPAAELTNNTILKKLRIAFTLKEDDVLRILDAGGSPTTRLALSPLFRKPGNKHFRACSDAVLCSFLNGLAG